MFPACPIIGIEMVLVAVIFGTVLSVLFHLLDFDPKILGFQKNNPKISR